MALCIRVLYDTFPEIKAVGCCHEVFHTQSLLCKALAEFEGIENVTRQQLETTVQGVNHFTFITKASYRGIDLYPVYRAVLRQVCRERVYRRRATTTG